MRPTRPGDLLDLLVDLEAAFDLDRLLGLPALDRDLPAWSRLVRDEREARRELDVDLDGGGVVALVRHAHVEAGEAVGGRRAGLERHMGGRGRR